MLKHSHIAMVKRLALAGMLVAAVVPASTQAADSTDPPATPDHPAESHPSSESVDGGPPEIPGSRLVPVLQSTKLEVARRGRFASGEPILEVDVPFDCPGRRGDRCEGEMSLDIDGVHWGESVGVVSMRPGHGVALLGLHLGLESSFEDDLRRHARDGVVTADLHLRWYDDGDTRQTVEVTIRL